MAAKKENVSKKKTDRKRKAGDRKPLVKVKSAPSSAKSARTSASPKAAKPARRKKSIPRGKTAVKGRVSKPRLTREQLSGWGRSDRAWSLGLTPDSLETLESVVGMKEPHHRIARGLGRAYGDAATNDGGLTVHFDRLDRAVSFDAQNGVLVAEAGMTLNDILRLALPHGWFLPVIPGTAHPTLGGSIACDVHGKNHHQAGTIGAHLQWIELIAANGERMRCGPRRNKALYQATAGGMGLTGLIYRAALRMKKIETSWIVEESYRVDNLRDMMARLSAPDATHPYTVSWMDGTATGRHLGQGQVLLGRHAGLSDLSGEARKHPLVFHEKGALTVPLVPPFSFVNNPSIRAFNFLRMQTASRSGRTRVVPFRPFFYLLDAVMEWNRVYGPRGFYQYQYVVPFDGAGEVLQETIDCLQKAGTPPSLIVLKRFGEQGDGMLSFPKPGWTIAIDIPVSLKLEKVLDKLDEVLLGADGRIYLAKDARMKPDTFRRMYSRFDEWLKIKQQVDPDWHFSSNLSRRLKMEEGV
ncbi:MAG: FAD-binding protein [bacterium]